MTHYVARNHETPREPKIVSDFYRLLERAPEELYQEMKNKPATHHNYQVLYTAVFGHLPGEVKTVQDEHECRCMDLPDGRGEVCDECRKRSHATSIPY